MSTNWYLPILAAVVFGLSRITMAANLDSDEASVPDRPDSSGLQLQFEADDSEFTADSEIEPRGIDAQAFEEIVNTGALDEIPEGATGDEYDPTASVDNRITRAPLGRRQLEQASAEESPAEQSPVNQPEPDHSQDSPVSRIQGPRRYVPWSHPSLNERRLAEERQALEHVGQSSVGQSEPPTQLLSGWHSQPVIPEAPLYQDFPGTAAPPPETVCAVNCRPFWEHRTSVWGEYLFLRPRNTDLVYASTVDGTLNTSVPLADHSVSDFGYASGFRAGLAWAINPGASVTANYTWYENNAIDSVGLGGGGGTFIASQTVHPNTLNVAADSLSAVAWYDIQLQMADVNYKGLLLGGDTSAFNYVVGVRYARLEQDFQADYTILGQTNVNTNVNFDGTGPRIGMESEHHLGCGFIGYGKGTVNVLVGTCSADFTQTNVFTGTQARTGLQDSRIVTVPELELGAGWQNYTGCIRVTAGYYIGAWFNMLTVPEYISSERVTQNSFQHDVRTLTLDGLSARFEYRF